MRFLRLAGVRKPRFFLRKLVSESGFVSSAERRVRSMFGAGSEHVPDLFGACSNPSSIGRDVLNVLRVFAVDTVLL